jgi:hypothetical protein
LRLWILRRTLALLRIGDAVRIGLRRRGTAIGVWLPRMLSGPGSGWRCVELDLFICFGHFLDVRLEVLGFFVERIAKRNSSQRNRLVIAIGRRRHDDVPRGSTITPAINRESVRTKSRRFRLAHCSAECHKPVAARSSRNPSRILCATVDVHSASGGHS